MKLFLYQILIFSLFVFSLANRVQKGLTNESFAFAEHDLPHFNMFKAFGIWVIRVISDHTYAGTHHKVILRDNNVYSFAYNSDKEIYNVTQRHIDGSKAIAYEFTNYTTNTLWNFQSIYLHQDEKILAILCFGVENKDVFLVSTRLGVNVDEKEIRKLIYDKLLPNPSFRRLIERHIPSLKWVNKNPVKLIPGTEDIPIHYDDLIDADVTKAVGNWTLRATTRTEHFINKLSHMNFRLEEDEIIVTAHSGDKEIGMGRLGYFPGTKLWKLDIFFPSFDQYVKIKLMLVYVDEDLNISLQTMKDDKSLHLVVLSRTDKPYDVNYVKTVIKKQLEFNPDIRRAIKDKLPNLTFF